MMMRKLTMILACGLALASCGRGTGKAPAAEPEPQARQFPVVSPPTMMTEQNEVMGYVATHFWKAFSEDEGRWIDDSAHVAGVETKKLEEQVGMFTTVLGMIPIETANKAVEAFYEAVEKMEAKDSSSTAFEEGVRLVAKYLYDPSSPVRNEDLYGTLARKLAKSPFVSEGMKASYENEIRLCALNSTGSTATDFSFVDKLGRRLSLHGIKAPYTLLFFTNPGCPSCADIIRKLKENGKITDMTRGGILSVVNIYIDEDLEAWREHLGDYPAEWITGYDDSLLIRTDLLYNVRAIPSLYLLDADKKVIMKDAPEDRVLSYLENIEE